MLQLLLREFKILNGRGQKWFPSANCLFSAEFPQNKERSEIASLKEVRSQVMCWTLFSSFRPRRTGNWWRYIPSWTQWISTNSVFSRPGAQRNQIGDHKVLSVWGGVPRFSSQCWCPNFWWSLHYIVVKFRYHINIQRICGPCFHSLHSVMPSKCLPTWCWMGYIWKPDNL